MGLFESDDVEDATVIVTYESNDNSTITGAAAVTTRMAVWDTAITTQHTDADNVEQPGNEVAAHGVTIPQYVLKAAADSMARSS
jgi:hypothetical protein